MQLGFVGLGAMGLPMTRHLVEAGPPGHRGVAQPRTRSTRAVALGAVEGGGPGRGGRRPPRWCSCACPARPRWPRWWRPCCPPSVRAQVVVDCSTIDPEVEPGRSTPWSTAPAPGILDAPLSGGTAGAEAGHADPDGRGRRGDPGPGPPGARPVRRARRPRRRARAWARW